MLVVRADGRAGGRSMYGHLIAKFSRMGSLPHFLIHGAPLHARELRYEKGNQHFLYNKQTHSFDNNVIITIIEQMRKENIIDEQKRDPFRHREIFWQKKLNSMPPNGLNKRIG